MLPGKTLCAEPGLDEGVPQGEQLKFHCSMTSCLNDYEGELPMLHTSTMTLCYKHCVDCQMRVL